MMLRLDLNVIGSGLLYESIEEYVGHLQGIIDKNISAGKVTVNQLEQAEPIGAPVRVRVTGNNMDRLGDVAEDIKKLLIGIQGTENVDDDFEDRIYEFVVNSDRIKTSHLGISNLMFK